MRNVIPSNLEERATTGTAVDELVGAGPGAGPGGGTGVGFGEHTPGSAI